MLIAFYRLFQTENERGIFFLLVLSSNRFRTALLKIAEMYYTA